MDMVGIMATGNLREQAVSYLNEAKMQADASTKTSKLKLLKEVLLHRDPSLLTEFVPHLMELQTERAAPIRNYLLQLIEDIGLKYLQYLPTMVPVLLTLMGDDMPAVARRAITVSSILFRKTFEQIALQGIYSGELDKIHEESWQCMITLKDAIYSASQQHKNDGVRLHAIKFIETVILLFTPEPNGPAQPPVQHNSEMHLFNFAWLLGGHPILNVASLGQEASKNLSILLDQLRTPETPKISGPIAAVLVNSLVSIAKQRPTLYGRVLPVLLGLVSSCEPIKGAQMGISSQTLKNAFTNLLKCSHTAACPWRERLISALNVIKGEDITEGSTSQMEKIHPKRPERENGGLEDQPEKRLRSSPDTANSGIEEITHLATIEEPTKDLSMSSLNDEFSSLQQMIAMVGALAAKGDQTVTSIDLLIANISAETLAEVVIEYMKYLPSNPPDVTASSALNLEVPWGTVATLEELFSLSALGTIIKPATHKRDSNRDPRRMRTTAEAKMEEPVLDTTSKVIGNIEGTVTVKTESLAATSSGEQIGFIPGISQIHVKDETIDDLPIPSGAPSAIVRTQGLAISLSTIAGAASGVGTLGPLVDTVVDTDMPDEKPLISATSTEEVTSVSGSDLRKEAQSIATVGTMLPAAWATTLSSIDAHQQQVLWKMLLMRIFQSYEEVESGGGTELRLSVLPRLIIGLDDDETWRILKEHILEDYQNHKGHELTIYTLYELFSKKIIEEDPDHIDAASVAYDTFLLAVAEGLRDTLPPSDNSLKKLLAEVPVLPVAALNLLGALCNPDSESKDGLESSVTERITQGLSAVWNLILLRPPIRSKCLDIALKCTVHHLEEVRTKAIRLVANKLYPLSYISENIEAFATKMMHSILEIRSQDGMRDMIGDGKEMQIDQVTEKVISKTQFNEQNVMDEDENAQKTSKTFVSIQEAQRCMSLFFALCTKKHSLLREVFTIYKDSPKVVKQAVHQHMPVLVRTIGCASPDVIQIISDPPDGSKNLVLLVLHVLTESSPPTAELIAAVKHLYEKKIKDAQLLTPILSSLSKEEVLPIFPQLVALPSQDFKSALDRILQGSVHTGPALTPAEVLILIHSIDPERDHIPLSMVKDACTVCFQQRTVFTQQVLAKVLNQLVEQTPLPILFMRTVILAVGAFRSLVSFVMEILSRLVNKQIWKWPNLWIGFLKCAEQTQPHSFPVLLQLPALQLEKALSRHPNLRALLMGHAAKPSIRSTLPRSTLVVLGLAQDTLPSEGSSGQPENSTATTTTTDVIITELPTPT